MLQIIVKGTFEDAKRVASEYQVEGLELVGERNEDGITDCTCQAPNTLQNWNQVSQWFAYYGPNVAPFPFGACLYYWERSEK